MAISFKESPWYIQALVFVALAILLLAAGEYVPGLAGGRGSRTQLQTLHDQDTKLNQEVSALQVYERRYAEFTAGDDRAQQATGYAQDHRSRR